MSEIVFNNFSSENDDNNQWKSFDFVTAGEISEIEVEFIQKHNLPAEVGEILGLAALKLSENMMYIASEQAGTVLKLLKSGTPEEISNCDLAWQAECVLLYSKIKEVLNFSTDENKIVELYKELTESKMLKKTDKVPANDLVFVPEENRDLPICNDVKEILTVLSKLAGFIAKSRMFGVKFMYLSGGIVFWSINNEYFLQDFFKGEQEHLCYPYIEHIGNTRLFQYSQDHIHWGLIDDTGRVLAPEVLRYVSLRP